MGPHPPSYPSYLSHTSYTSHAPCYTFLLMTKIPQESETTRHIPVGSCLWLA